VTSTSFERLVVIDGMPRSGTSWLAQIVESCPIVRYRLCPLFAYQFKGRIDEASGRADWIALLEDAYNADDAYMSREHERADRRYPVFAERVPMPPVLALKFDRFHDLMPDLLRFFTDDQLRIVFLVRHPCGAIHSWLTAPREFPADADPLEHWRDGRIKKQAAGDFFGFDDWKAVTRMQVDLERRYPLHVRILRYEALAAHPARESRSLFDHLMLPYGEQTSAFIAASQASHDPDPYAVFKAPAVANRWQSELSPKIREAILDDLRGGELERFTSETV
jgi:hypothetical protein